jgi:hypothetical protein
MAERMKLLEATLRVQLHPVAGLRHEAGGFEGHEARSHQRL